MACRRRKRPRRKNPPAVSKPGDAAATARDQLGIEIMAIHVSQGGNVLDLRCQDSSIPLRLTTFSADI